MIFNKETDYTLMSHKIISVSVTSENYCLLKGNRERHMKGIISQ